MLNRSSFPGHVALVCAALLLAAASLTASAQSPSVQSSFADSQKETTPINVLVGQSRVINFDKPIGRFSVSNPDIAEAVLVAPDQVLVNGKAFGQVNFIAWEQKGSRFLVFDVYVRTNLSLIDAQIRALFPKDDIRLSQANGSVVISGSVATAKTGEQVEQVVQAAGFKTVNMLQSPVKDMTQVQLQVRVAEVSRSRLRDLGASYAYESRPGVGGFVGSGGGPYSVDSVTSGNIAGTVAGSALNLFVMGGNTFNFLRALQTSGAIRELAEPNLIAMDGQQASFLAGGEYPVPVVQSGTGGNAVSIVFKEYGVRLNFKPTIIDEDHIRLELEPEVSTIDFANGVKFDGFLIPALKTRRAKTGVELRDGQSFALAGLLDNSDTRSLSKVPLIGDVPIIGNLFKSKSFQKQETELMFIITAQLVKPVNRDDLPAMRGMDGLKGTSPLGVEPKGEGIKGPSGFSTGGDKTSGAGVGNTTNGGATNGGATNSTKSDSTTSGSSATTNGATTGSTLSTSTPALSVPAADAAAQTPAKQATSTDATSANASNGSASASKPADAKAAARETTDATAQQASVKPQP
ncbi:MAG TPA: type II and III secretion system protein family protein [Pyrinomonadaceae bacterium]|nr:type II and III secretion system protein family protein [Pyrinomonadaceae bacterium]